MPDEKIVEAAAKALPHGNTPAGRHLATAALAAARPLLEAEIRKDEREKTIDDMLELACQRDDDWHRNARQFLHNFCVTDSKNGEG